MCLEQTIPITIFILLTRTEAEMESNSVLKALEVLNGHGHY